MVLWTTSKQSQAGGRWQFAQRLISKALDWDWLSATVKAKLAGHGLPG
jgi:hypothetical protein